MNQPSQKAAPYTPNPKQQKQQTMNRNGKNIDSKQRPQQAEAAPTKGTAAAGAWCVCGSMFSLLKNTTRYHVKKKLKMLRFFFFFFFFFKSSGGWVKIKLKLPHYYVGDRFLSSNLGVDRASHEDLCSSPGTLFYLPVDHSYLPPLIIK